MFVPHTLRRDPTALPPCPRCRPVSRKFLNTGAAIRSSLSRVSLPTPDPHLNRPHLPRPSRSMGLTVLGIYCRPEARPHLGRVSSAVLPRRSLSCLQRAAQPFYSFCGAFTFCMSVRVAGFPGVEVCQGFAKMRIMFVFRSEWSDLAGNRCRDVCFDSVLSWVFGSDANAFVCSLNTVIVFGFP